jgi:hypothetical protein
MVKKSGTKKGHKFYGNQWEDLNIQAKNKIGNASAAISGAVATVKNTRLNTKNLKSDVSNAWESVDKTVKGAAIGAAIGAGFTSLNRWGAVRVQAKYKGKALSKLYAPTAIGYGTGFGGMAKYKGASTKDALKLGGIGMVGMGTAYAVGELAKKVNPGAAAIGGAIVGGVIGGRVGYKMDREEARWDKYSGVDRSFKPIFETTVKHNHSATNVLKPIKR